MKKMTEQEVLETAVAAEPEEFDLSFLNDPELPEKMSNDDLPPGVAVAEQVAVTIFQTPVGPRIYLSGTVEDPDRVIALFDMGHAIARTNGVNFYLGFDDEDDYELPEEEVVNSASEHRPATVGVAEDLEKKADEAGHMVVKEGYVGGGAMTAGDIV